MYLLILPISLLSVLLAYIIIRGSKKEKDPEEDENIKIYGDYRVMLFNARTRDELEVVADKIEWSDLPENIYQLLQEEIQDKRRNM